MPETPIYGWPYEHPVLDEPGITLHGGALGQGRILAEEIEATVAALAGTVSGQQDALGALDAVAAQTIATIDTGDGTNTTEFTQIPATFRDLMIFWRGASNGSGQIDALALRFNGDNGTNYHSRILRNQADSTFNASSGENDNFTFSVMRVGMVGTAHSAGVIYIPDYAGSQQKYAHGTCSAVGQSGLANVYGILAGGRWTSTAPITSIRLWPSSQAWAGHPHLTLVGIR